MTKLSLAFAAFFIFVIGFDVYKTYGTQETVTFTVTDKERITSSDNSYYLVFTENEVFRNEDATLLFKFNSSDVQGSMKIGATCEAVVYGFRIRVFSMYRNIWTVNCNE